MDFPTVPPLKLGQRYVIQKPLSPALTSADAHYLGGLGLHLASASRCLVVICADAQDAQRLAAEMPFFAPSLRIGVLPDWETLPYDPFSPHQDLISERLATLWKILQKQLDVVLIPATTALYRLAPPAFLAAYTFDFQTGQKLDESALKSQLTMAGYSHVSNVVGPGEYAVRGGLIDLFPMGSSVPYRVDLFDDEIDSIRAFDPDTQRSLYPVPNVHLLPGREFPMDDTARAQFRSRWRERMEGDPAKSRVYKDIGAGIATAGIEYYLPLFFDETATVFDYFAADDVFLLHGEVQASFALFWQDVQERFRLAAGDAERPVMPASDLFLSEEGFFTSANAFAQIAMRGDDSQPSDFADFYQTLPVLRAERQAEEALTLLQNYVKQSGQRVLLLAASEGRRESLRDFLRTNHLLATDCENLASFIQNAAENTPNQIAITVADLNYGFNLVQHRISLLTESELFVGGPNLRRHKKQEQASDVQTLIQDLSELQTGDPVVHSQHGIGRYRGLVHMDLAGDGEPQEFLHLEYADQALLYVPVGQLHLISRYTGVSADEAPLHKLGSAQWDKAKRKAAEQVRDSAAELLNIYASRAARQGHAFRFDAAEYERFAKDFGFEETADQLSAIHHVIQEMISPKPMDRLVCGDVGFGKTEVALRAAFVAVHAGKQVAILAPTTLLAEQHYQTLTDRFSKWPVKIVEMSRFRSTQEINAAAKGLADGSVDIVVGTHKLLSPNIQFKNLGLLIIDEEHRFGVRHKEAMKALRAEVDILTLTATPIPRTMGMALEGLRDLSVIATAPQRRLSIKTFVRTENKGVIREAVLRELKRGGQCYFLHNEVETIQNRREYLEALLPEARIAVAHGQMPERELERVMRDFVAQRSNILLCSTIIETGIDVPSANTIIMSRADKFGLAQLHQLRGRVGRSHHQAYAYLMVPDVQSLSKAAAQRMDAIQQMEELGSGFYLAMHDLEIRGAGEVLGENQSGNMMEVGFQLYNEMLSEAVRALKEGQEPDLLKLGQSQTDINLHAPCLLPANYCGDVHLRLSFYKKLAMCKTEKQVGQIQEEIADRFGKLPEAAHNLFAMHRLRILGQPYQLLKVDARAQLCTLSFAANAPIDPAQIIALIQKNRHIKLAGNDKLRIECNLPDVNDRVHMLRDTLRALGSPLKLALA